ncbi:MAG: ABC transporter permease [Saprospiraceae bacterium]
MNNLGLAFIGELIKLKNSSIVWITFIAFSLAPIMGGVFMWILQDPHALSRAGALAAKANAMNFSQSWDSYFNILSQAVGVGGIMVFGFVISWLFGREYTEGTAKDLLSLPTSRTTILNAKFMVYCIWCVSLVLLNLIIGWMVGFIFHLAPLAPNQLLLKLSHYFITTLLAILVGFPIAFFAIWGKGYLAPLGFVALTLVISQIVAAAGFGNYFPWSIPGLFSGAAGEFKTGLHAISYLILIGIALTGYITTILYWNKADQST